MFYFLKLLKINGYDHTIDKNQIDGHFLDQQLGYRDIARISGIKKRHVKKLLHMVKESEKYDQNIITAFNERGEELYGKC